MYKSMPIRLKQKYRKSHMKTNSQIDKLHKSSILDSVTFSFSAQCSMSPKPKIYSKLVLPPKGKSTSLDCEERQRIISLKQKFCNITQTCTFFKSCRISFPINRSKLFFIQTRTQNLEYDIIAGKYSQNCVKFQLWGPPQFVVYCCTLYP